jgi:hypothetical protein
MNGIAAATVNSSARIGDSRSTYYEGVSPANQLAIKFEHLR